jgi:inner membrane protein
MVPGFECHIPYERPAHRRARGTRLTAPVDLSIAIFLIFVGIVLLGIEFAHPGVFLLIPGSIALAAGLLYLFLPGILLGTLYGPSIVIIVAVVAALATIPYYRRIAPIHRPMSTTVHSLEGEMGVVVAEVVPDTLRGKVRIGSEIWSARSDRRIPPGTRVRVLGGEGVSVTVQPAEGVPASAGTS